MGIKENLKKINKTFLTTKFNNLKNAIQLDSSTYNIKVMKLFKKDFYNDFVNNEIKEEKKPEIIKIKKSNYYLIDNKLYKIKKDKTQGEYYSDYINGEIILVNNKKQK